MQYGTTNNLVEQKYAFHDRRDWVCTADVSQMGYLACVFSQCKYTMDYMCIATANECEMQWKMSCIMYCVIQKYNNLSK